MILGHTLAALGWPEPSLVTSFWCTSIMYGKRQLPYDVDQIPAARRLRANIADLFLRNECLGSARAASARMGRPQGHSTWMIWWAAGQAEAVPEMLIETCWRAWAAVASGPNYTQLL